MSVLGLSFFQHTIAFLVYTVSVTAFNSPFYSYRRHIELVAAQAQ